MLFLFVSIGIEQAMNWVLEHAEDPGKHDFRFFRDKIYRSRCTVNDSATCLLTADFAVPLSVPGSSATESVNEEAVAMIISMGFTQSQAIKALKATVSIILGHCSESWNKELFLVRRL